LIDRAAIVPEILGLTGDGSTPSATTASAATASSNDKNRSTPIAHPDAAAITFLAPGVVLPAWGITQLLL